MMAMSAKYLGVREYEVYRFPQARQYGLPVWANRPPLRCVPGGDDDLALLMVEDQGDGAGATDARRADTMGGRMLYWSPPPVPPPEDGLGVDHAPPVRLAWPHDSDADSETAVDGLGVDQASPVRLTWPHDSDADSETAEAAPASAVAGTAEPILPQPQDVAQGDISAALVKLIANRDINTITMGSLRSDVTRELGLAGDALDTRAEEIKALAVAVVNQLGKKVGVPHRVDDELREEKLCVKSNYLATLPHPQIAELRAPGEMSAQIKDTILHAFHASNNTRKKALHLYNVASHWSDSHDTYASTVSYGYLCTPKKPSAELDPEPLLWPKSRQELPNAPDIAFKVHPSLEIASRTPTTSKAISDRREALRLARSGEGKDERRFEELDLWPIVVNEGIKADSDATERVIAYARRCGGQSMVKFCFMRPGYNTWCGDAGASKK